MNKKILYFSDLEGTILRESDGDFDDAELYNFISELTKLGELLDSEVEVRLVSPIGFKRMNKVVDRMERIIGRHSSLTKTKTRVSLAEAVASSFDIENDIFADRRISKKISELPKVYRKGSNPARDAKRKYVDLVLDSEPNPENIALCIYAGNGRNDVDAMRVLKSRNNGIIICPQNSRREVKELAHFASSKTDIRGVIDGVQKINEKISERTNGANRNLESNTQERIQLS